MLKSEKEKKWKGIISHIFEKKKMNDQIQCTTLVPEIKVHSIVLTTISVLTCNIIYKWRLWSSR